MNRPVEAYNLDLVDRVTNVVNIEGQTMHLTYDQAGRLQTVRHPDQTTFGYYANNLPMKAENDCRRHRLHQ